MAAPAIRKEHGELVEATLKTHQQRRIALDSVTVTGTGLPVPPAPAAGTATSSAP